MSRSFNIIYTCVLIFQFVARAMPSRHSFLKALANEQETSDEQVKFYRLSSLVLGHWCRWSCNCIGCLLYFTLCTCLLDCVLCLNSALWHPVCQNKFCFCRSRFPYHIQQLFSPVFQWVVRVLLHCLPADQCRQQTASCKVVVLWWMLTTVGCHFLLHLLLHYLQSSHSPMKNSLTKMKLKDLIEFFFCPELKDNRHPFKLASWKCMSFAR